MANYATLKAAINAVIKANGQREITGTVLNQTLNAMVNSLGANYQLAGVATPSTNPGTPDQNVFYLAFEAGTYTNFNAIVLSAGISILMWNGSWSSQTFYTIDTTPTASSNNLVSSGAVFDALKTDGSAYDVSAHFPTGGPNSDGKFTLEYILSNANTLIPTAWRKGGMSIRFVSTSDNKYVQFFCMAKNFTTDVTQWQGVDEKPEQNSKNLVESGGVERAIKDTNIEIDGDVLSLGGARSTGYIYNIHLKNNESYKIITDSVAADMTALCWQIDGVKNGVSTTIFGCLPTANRTLNTANLDYDSYNLKIVQDITSGTFKIIKSDNCRNLIEHGLNDANNNIDLASDFSKENRKIIDGGIFFLRGRQSTGDVPFKSGVIENGKAYTINASLNVNTPSDIVFNIFGVKNGVSTALFGCTATAVNRIFKTFNDNGNYEYDSYFYRIHQQITDGSLDININAPYYTSHKDDINTLKEITKQTKDYIAEEIDGRIINENRNYAANTYINADFKAGYEYRLQVNTDYTGTTNPVILIECYRNGSWSTYAGTLGVADRTLTIPQDATESRLRIVYACSGTIVVTNLSSIKQDIVKINASIDELSPEEVIITANSDENSDADFVGNNAIQLAFDSITDASAKKIYTIRATGEFIAKVPTDYHVHMRNGNPTIAFTFIDGKDYVNIDGISKNQCIIRCELPDTVSANREYKPDFAAADYALYQPFYWDYNSSIKNVTIMVRNIRYPLHIDTSFNNMQNWFKINVEDSDLIHEGKYGDAVGSVGGSANGFAVSQGMVLTLVNCNLITAQGNPYAHDNKEFKYPGTINYINCAWYHRYPRYNNNPSRMLFECYSKYGVSSIMNVYGCLLPSDIRCRGYMNNLDTIKRNADSICNIINIDSYPLPQDAATVSTIALCITSNSSSNGSSVRVDKDSSAFDAIFGYSDETAFIQSNNYCRRRQYGYEYKDGGNGLKGIAIGTRNVSQSLISGTSYPYANWMGKRLGDCSVTNKILTVIIDGVSHDIVFDKNYDGTAADTAPNYTTAQILAEMNTALSGYANVSLYSIDNDWMPNYLKGVEVKFNGDTDYIESGMGVVFDGNNVRKAKQSDGRIDGIALDSAAVGDNLRIITGGKICYQEVRYSLKKVSGSPDISTLSFGTKISISQTDGVFEVGTDCPVAKIGIGNTVII